MVKDWMHYPKTKTSALTASFQHYAGFWPMQSGKKEIKTSRLEKKKVFIWDKIVYVKSWQATVCFCMA